MYQNSDLKVLVYLTLIADINVLNQILILEVGAVLLHQQIIYLLILIIYIKPINI